MGQVKIVAKGPGDGEGVVSYVSIWLDEPQLLHSRMITFCKSLPLSSTHPPTHSFFPFPSLISIHSLTHPPTHPPNA